jgi:hypothetical protein
LLFSLNPWKSSDFGHKVFTIEKGGGGGLGCLLV